MKKYAVRWHTPKRDHLIDIAWTRRRAERRAEQLRRRYRVFDGDVIYVEELS
jgi:hypothetical protein